MVRENNKKEKAQEEDMPEFGAGSEYGKAQRDEAKRKKYGFVSRKYNPDAQPWLMRVGNKKEGKHYRGVREGGVSENTCYYVFTHAQDGSFEAHPIKEWYNFTPRVSYKTLDAEEAEERFAERGKILNHWSMMVNKKLKSDQDLDGDDLDGDSSGKKSKKDQKATKSLKISDMDDWADSEDGMDSDEDGPNKGSDDDGGRKKGKGKDSRQKKKKSKEDVEDEMDDKFEDSDDGDGEDREVDYITDESSEDEEENPEYDQKGVDQAKALSKLLDSESSSEDEEKKKSDDEGDDEDEAGNKKKKKKTDDTQEDGSTKEDKTEEGEDEKAKKAEKRKALVDNLLDPNAAGPSKKSRMDSFPPSAGVTSTSASNGSSSFEEDVRRYLSRKPMTTTELLKKLKSKSAAIDNDELMPLLVSALKRINPHKQKVKGVMYLSLKPNN